MSNTETIESLLNFAFFHNEMAFVDLCDAALAGEEWAVERIGRALACGKAYPVLLLDIIRTTDCSRPDVAIARQGVEP